MSPAFDEFPAAAADASALPRLGDDDWQRILAVLPQKTATRARNQPQPTRRFIEATLWIAITGEPWRYLPAEFGPWRAHYMHFLRWTQQGTWRAVVAAMHDAQQRAPLQRLANDYLCGAGTD